jgi:hypothetical protein
MTGIVIGSVENGRSVIEVNGNGMTRATIAVDLEVTGATTMAAVSEATGTTTMRMTVGGVTINPKTTLVVAFGAPELPWIILCRADSPLALTLGYVSRPRER